MGRKLLQNKELPATCRHYTTSMDAGQAAQRRATIVTDTVRQVLPGASDTVLSQSPRLELTSLERPELEHALVARGHPRFRAQQVFQWLYRRGMTDPAAMLDLPSELRRELADCFDVRTPQIVSRERSTDGTEKFLLRLADDRRIESVFIPDSPGPTFCISTQVGCAVGCTFCLTGRMGLVRHLTAGEIAGQVRVLRQALALGTVPFNIVLMGMGEPLHNYDETMRALRILADPHGLAIPMRRVTLSTIGLVPALEQLAREPLMPNLAISLHAVTDEQRAALVPIARKYALEDILKTCRRFPLKKRARITFEYVLLAGVNDSPAHARTLAKRLAGLKAKVNLIPLNAAAGIPFERPEDEVVNRFARILAERGVTVSVRKSRGRDIRAACGQLIVEGTPLSPAQRLATVAFVT